MPHRSGGATRGPSPFFWRLVLGLGETSSFGGSCYEKAALPARRRTSCIAPLRSAAPYRGVPAHGSLLDRSLAAPCADRPRHRACVGGRRGNLQPLQRAADL